MSLTATLLFNRQFTLPNGKPRFNEMDAPAQRPTKPMAEYRKVQASGRAANLDRLVAAIAAGANTMESAAKATGLSLSMVKKSMPDLEDAGRVIRVKSGKHPHRFKVIK